MVKSNMFIIIAVLAFLYNHIDIIFSSLQIEKINFTNIDESHSYSYKENMGVNGVEILKMTREPTFNSQSINNSLFLFFTDKCLFILVLALSNKKKFTEFIVLFLIWTLIRIPEIKGDMASNLRIDTSSNIYMNGIVTLNEEGFISCGYIKSESTTKAYISKISRGRVTQWDYELINIYSEKCNAIVANTSGEVFIAIESNTDSINNYLRIVKISLYCGILWDKLIEEKVSYPTEIDLDLQSGIIGICGNSIGINSRFICWVDFTSTLAEHKCFYGLNSATTSGLVISSIGNIVVIGTFDGFATIHTYSKKTSDVIFDEQFLAGSNTNGYAIRRLANGKFIIAGKCFDGTTKAFIAIISETLYLLNHKIINIPESSFISVAQLFDNSIIASGWYSSMNSEKALFIKFTLELNYDAKNIEICEDECYFNGIAFNPKNEYAIAVGNAKHSNKSNRQIRNLFSCSPGHYRNILTSVCYECANGEYQDEPNQIYCKPCPAGNYTPDKTRCVACKPGTYQDQGGQSSCKPCSSSQYQDEYGKTTCKGCPAGRFMPDRTKCTDCPAGTYQSLPNQSSCTACPSSGYQPFAGQTLCDECVPGHYKPDATKCLICEPGKYTSTAGESFCKICPAGNYMPNNYSCIQCALGQYQDQDSQPSCKNCPTGQYADSVGQTECKICSAGNYMPDNTRCISCSAGTYQNQNSQSKCIACPSGEYQPYSGQIACIPCLAGNYLVDSKTCNPCPAGQFQNQNGQSSCIACPAGEYQPDTGKPSCIPCLAGNYLLNSEQCIPCETGKYQDNDGQYDCKACPIDEYQDELGQASCKICHAGNYMPDRTKCLPCDPGTFQQNDKMSKCDPCPGGYFAENSGTVTCSQCTINSQGPLLFEGQSECQYCSNAQVPDPEFKTTCACPPGYGYVMDTCTKCSVGFYKGTFGNTACLECSLGKYQNNEGSTACIDCNTGDYQDLQGQISCKLCTAGNYTPDPSKCLPCDPGYYQDENGKSECKPCEAGYHASSSGTIICTICPILPNGPLMLTGRAECANCPGTRVPEPITKAFCVCPPGASPNRFACKDCIPGYFKPEYANTICLPCGQGYVQPDSGKRFCIPCAKGYHQGATAQTTCQICTKGTYQSNEGKADCINCGPGQYTDTDGAPMYKECDVNYYQPLPIQSKCLPCGPGKYQNNIGASFCNGIFKNLLT